MDACVRSRSFLLSAGYAEDTFVIWLHVKIIKIWFGHGRICTLVISRIVYLLFVRS